MLNYRVGRGISALQFVNGKDAEPLEGIVFTQHKRHRVIVTVRSGTVNVSVDGDVIIDWKGDGKQLTPSTYWTTPDKNALMIGSYDCCYRWYRLSIEPLSGEGKVIDSAMRDRSTSAER